MTNNIRFIVIGLIMGLGSVSAQTMVETVTTVGMQNTLQSVGTPTLNGLPKPSTISSSTTSSSTTSSSTIAQGQSAPTTDGSTPLTASQQALLTEAQAALQAKSYPEARKLFETLIAQNYNNPEPHFGLALTFFALKDDKAATFELNQFRNLTPDRYEGPYNLGVIASRQGRFDEALKLYSEAAILMKDKAPAAAQRQILNALAIEQNRKADFVSLTTTLTALVTLNPDDLDVQYRLAQSQMLSGKGTQALPGLYNLLQKNPKHVDAALLLADIYVSQNMPDRAIRELDLATKRVNAGLDRSKILLRKGDLQAAQGDIKNAVLTTLEATKEDGKNITAFAHLAELKIARNDRAGAATAYLSAVALAPKNASYRTALASLRLAMNQNADANKDATLALTLRPDEATLAKALFVQGVSSYRLGKYPAATTALQSSMSRSGNAETALWLGLSAYAGKNYPLAASALADSVKLNPTAVARLNLSSALLATARYQEAETILRGLTVDEPKNAKYWYLLGLALRSQYKEGEAKTSFKTAAHLGSTKAKGALK